MEVMSILLLCALVALSPQTLGIQTALRNAAGNFMIRNHIKMIQQKPKHKLLLNLNGQPMIFKVSELQNVFNDIACSGCVECMERAILASRESAHFKEDQYPSGEFQEENILTNTLRIHREKRSVNETGKARHNIEKRTKTKRGKSHKHVTVTKYTLDGVPQALKVKEFNSNDKPGSSCGLYSIANAFQCNSPEAEEFLASVKRKNSPKKHVDHILTNKVKKSVDSPTIAPVPRSITIYKKREVDNSQLPENIMTSFEDFY